MNNQNYRETGLILILCKLWYLKSYIILLMLATVFSCAPLDEAVPDPNVSESNLPILTRSPSAVDDRVYFDDFEEFMDYYDDLDSLYVLDLDVFDSILLADSPVQTINELYSASLDYETFLADPIMRGILNPDYEFQVGDAIIAYVNNSEILVFDVGNSSAKSSIRGLAKGEPIDIEEIPSGAYWGRPDDMERAFKIGCGCSIYIWPSTDCDFLRVWGRCNSLWGNDGDGLLTVTFDDFPLGFPIQVLQEEVSGNFNFLINVTSSLIFTDDGIVHGWVDPECVLAENAATHYTFDPASFAGCDLDHQTRDDVIEDGDERMSISTSWWRNNHGYSCHKAEIRSESRDDEFSEWERTSARLEVDVAANLNSPACNFVDDKDDDASCNSCKGKSTVVRWSTTDIAHCDGDLVGGYQKIRNNITLEEVEHIVDFECCEE